MKLPSLRQFGQIVFIPALAVITALAVGAIIMLIFGDNPIEAYRGLFQGAFGSARGWSTTLRKMTPLILTGLSVAVAFRAGLFNIGASGQFIMGTVAAVAVGVNFEGLPPFLHLPLALLAGIAGGAFWGFIPGALKVFTGAHEVITTIMLNYIASLFAGVDGLCRRHPGADSRPALGSHGRAHLRDGRRVHERPPPLYFRRSLSGALGRGARRGRGPPHGLGDLQDDAGLRDPHGGPEQQGRPLRRHQHVGGS